ncbi:hypothetical protein M1247_24830 [Mycobacterium sp. 21AC1]|uniref:hypothetical protein n=1 Tax=[Mycobacterium] appelbergii TaxID=2939269 RepID=UPI00293941D9|nr:hypothetical protein [Mycobacterium sp. 21AC1]MDV3128163.1 hypothetical protein [Mycobacterium sp. 21AC1]
MLIIALVLAVIGLAALVTAVVTSNELIAWVCIGASVIGVVLLIIDALRERSRSAAGSQANGAVPDSDETTEVEESEAVDYPEEAPAVDEIEPYDAESDGGSHPEEQGTEESSAVSDETSDEKADEPKN